jgi:hypothetical protein
MVVDPSALPVGWVRLAGMPLRSWIALACLCGKNILSGFFLLDTFLLFSGWVWGLLLFGWEIFCSDFVREV